MAIGLLLVILGIWVLINSFNGNIVGLFQNQVKIDTEPKDGTTYNVISNKP